MVCNAPKCFRPKEGRCMYPNPWIFYVMEQSGKGKSRSEIRDGYHAWKAKKFRNRTGPSDSARDYRARVMCAERSNDKQRAATMLQARGRGQFVRQVVMARRRRETAKRRSDERKAATAIQEVQRRRLARVKAAKKRSDDRRRQAAKTKSAEDRRKKRRVHFANLSPLGPAIRQSKRKRTAPDWLR